MPAPKANWGGFPWGFALWGAGVPAAAGGATQSATANALKSTVFLGQDGSVDTDESQYGTDLTATAQGGYELSSARCAITSPRTLYFDVTWNVATENTYTYLYHGNTAKTDYTFLIGLDGSGDIIFGQNGSTLLTVAASGFTGGVSQMKIQWSTRSNPDTTGAGDAMISEVTIYDASNTDLQIQEQFTHAVATTNSAWNFCIGGYWNGASMSEAPVVGVARARVDGAFYNHVHFGSHWVAQRTDGAPSTAIETMEPLAPDYASGIGAQNEFAGPHLCLTAEQVRQMRYRMLSPLVNEVYSSATPALTNSYTPAAWHKKPPGSSVYRWNIGWLRWVVVPDNCNYLFTRVQIHSSVSSGASVPVGIRVYSFNRNPVLGKKGYDDQEPPPYEGYYAFEKLDADHGSNPGAWVVDGYLKIARNDSPSPKFGNTTLLCIAYAIDPDSESANDAAESLIVKAWSAVPCARVLGNGINIPPGGDGGMKIDNG